MNKDMSRCSALFCPLEHDCARKDHIGRPVNDRLSFADFSELLKEGESGEFSCAAQVTN